MTFSREIDKLTHLLRTTKKIFNQQLEQVYGDARPNSNRAQLRDLLKIEDDDIWLVLLVKMFLFYFGCGRVPLIQTEPYIPASLRPKMIPHAYVMTRPDDRRKYSDGTYDYNGLLKIDWFDPEQYSRLRNKGYKMGNKQLRLNMGEERCYVIINCQSEEEGKKFLEVCHECIYPARRGKGSARDNISVLERPKNAKKHSRDGVFMRVYAIDWRNGRGEMPFGRFQL